MTTEFAKLHGLNFKLPNTQYCRVIYTRNGTKYSAILPTPRSHADLQVAMLNRQVGMSQVTKVEPTFYVPKS